MTLYMQWSLSIVTTTGTTSLGPRPYPPHHCYYWLHNSSDMRMWRIDSGFRTNWDHCLSFITFYLFIYYYLFNSRGVLYYGNVSFIAWFHCSVCHYIACYSVCVCSIDPTGAWYSYSSLLHYQTSLPLQGQSALYSQR